MNEKSPKENRYQEKQKKQNKGKQRTQKQYNQKQSEPKQHNQKQHRQKKHELKKHEQKQHKQKQDEQETSIVNGRRQKTRRVFYGQVAVGGEAPISVQSMTNTDTRDVEATVAQIEELTAAGCDIIRVAVPDMSSAAALEQIKQRISIPLIADIHFDYRLALEAVKKGVDGLRINPGNIAKKEHVKQIVAAAGKAEIPIRVGVNSGSIEDDILQKYGQPTARGMVESALGQVEVLETESFNQIVISLKATDIWMTKRACSLLAREVDYPLHIGITEAGSGMSGIIKSAAGLGTLLLDGLGDTLRVSLTGDPLTEVKVGRELLEVLDLSQRRPRVISCPTCARTGVDLVKLTEDVKQAVSGIEQPITVAVMGCAVNGPGEAREADIGIAAGKGEGIIFKNGEKIKKVAEEKLVSALKSEIKNLRGAE